MSSTTRPRASAGSATKRNSGGSGGGGRSSGGGNELIVTRGLQDILEQDLSKKRASTSGHSGAGGSAMKRKSGGSGGGGARATGPNFVICYLCGRQFGTASIGIHRPQCYLKKMIEWERGDAALRGPRPVDPETHEKQMQARMAAAAGGDTPVAGATGGSGKQAEMDAYNAAQFEAFQTQALVPCPHCGRTFLPDRLQVHLRSCKPGATAEPIQRASVRGAAGTESSAGAGAAPARATPAAKSSGAPQPARGLEEQPIKASGAYTLPDGVAEDSAPPSSGNHKAASQAASPMQRGNGGGKRPERTREESDSDSDVVFVEEVGEEAAPVSPPSADVSTEEAARRHSATAAAEPDGMSTPTRYASMEPGTDDETRRGSGGDQALSFHNYVAEERRASASPPAAPHNTQDAANAVDTALARRESGADAVVEPQPPRRSSGLPSEEEGQRLRAENGRRSSAGASAGSVEDGKPQPAEEEGKRSIPLNNVSRFRNVPSRLKQQQQQVSLTPCSYCGRTFNPARIAKHESCCLERNKTPASAVNRPRKSAGGPPPASAKRPPSSGSSAAASTAPDTAAGPGSGPRFCGECGAKFATVGQKFCSECGAKCVA